MIPDKKYFFNWPLLIAIPVITALSLFISGQSKLTKAEKKPLANFHDRGNFPLAGKHRDLACSECHRQGMLKGTPTSCEACHWYRRQDDRYKLRLGIHCAECHTPFDWKKTKPNAWDHQRMTGFALRGAHRLLDCFSCHRSQTFTRLSTRCIDCHQADYNRTDEPNHSQQHFPTDCGICHTMNSWEGARFTHTKFIRKGRHLTVSCGDCHSKGVYTGISQECVSCHLADYNRTTDPNHKKAGFSTQCVTCHGDSAVGWENASFDHSQFFVLKGAHKQLDCLACHRSGYNLSRECYSCHRKDYESTRDPNHRQAGFSTDCVTCHGDKAINWENASFNHNQFFVLLGPHKRLDCQACHVSGYNLPHDCYGCHRKDYESARDPNHASAGFPTECKICHYPAHFAWSQAVFNHSFPITSGKHANFSCSECHQSSNFQVFSCLDCHVHAKNEMDDKHSGVGGYSYNSLACLNCHPRGIAD